MDFNYNDDQKAIGDVANRIFRDLCDDEAVRLAYRQPQPFQQDLWKQLADSGILGTPLPEALGGSEMGMTELCLALEAQGRQVAAVPLLETVVECALPIARFAAETLRQELIPEVIRGDLILAPIRPYQGLQEFTPLTAVAQGDQWALNGFSNHCGYAGYAQGFLVTAKLDSNRLWVGYCPAKTDGVRVTRQRSTHGESGGHVQFTNVLIQPEHCIAIHDEADELIRFQTRNTYAALAALQIGVLGDGLRRAADYTRERTQFNRPLAAFQAVAQQMADGYMAVEALRGVYWRLLDILDNGQCETARAQLAAHTVKYWIAQSGHKAAHIFLHVHGGIGQDLDFPIHRYFSWAKKNELYLGASADQSQALGKLVQARPDLVA